MRRLGRTYEEKWERERKRQARCAELFELHTEHNDRCRLRRKRKSCKKVHELQREGVKLFCRWAQPHIPSRFHRWERVR
jgi:hypothetical protein